MKDYLSTDQSLWTGRVSGKDLYLHETVRFVDLRDKDAYQTVGQTDFALLGYACDEGVRRNGGRTGAVEGPDHIRRQLAKLPNQLAEGYALFDGGTISCTDGNMERAQNQLADTVSGILGQGAIPVLIGGGHDIAYGHYHGIRQRTSPKQNIGILNFDAHFDLRPNEQGNNSGTPFYQLAREAQKEGLPFHYMCLGIRKDANDRALYENAREFGVSYLEAEQFQPRHFESVRRQLKSFMDKVDKLYVTIDLDGFSSAYAPGVSAASPMGFSPQLVLDCLREIVNSGKLISLDIAELNPAFDRDDQTAKLAASLIHYAITAISYSNQEL
ncbi:formimidoylglutamase [Poritiphilus flavus]|uniref:Formimidoylglutamase n=1 Tax=Poritiphilus flavus TaxID=2697053 RepID=A0A6L9E6Y6_9FLAO|nr:formimidoylglutamase [Poritiphilus flavus]NAS10466.1 formimidoylglutamase [Poritiphilus flavus]